MCVSREKLDLKDQTSKMYNPLNAPVKSINVQNASRISKIPGRRMSQSIQHIQEEKYPELTMRSFFEFMRTAYGVNNSFEELVDTVTANSEIDWSALAKTELNSEKVQDKELNETDLPLKNEETIKCTNSELKIEEPKDDEASSSGSQINNTCQNVEPVLSKIMKKHLSDVLHEGLLDSVLPYMIPRTTLSVPAIKKTCANVEPRKSISLGDDRDAAKAIKEKAKEKESSNTRRKSFESEIEIHVCDEAKNIKKDFRCPQRLLIQNMCYFADVTAGQKLEEMDISVHCDIVIFDWLMRWVKRDIIKKSEWPILEATNVIPIMVSASFLQMEPLLNNCLIFCHNHMSDILKTSSVLSCLNDDLLTRLADLFTNVEVESLKDKKDKIQSKLFCKLILALGNPVPDNSKGHFSSLATLFKCGKCEKYIIRSLSDFIPCIPSAMRIDKKGHLHSKHTRHLTWNLDDYIVALRSELRSWRKVYWRLWGDCHFIFCRQCDTYFPINQMDWCAYHPEVPQFFVNEQQKNLCHPIGRYPCCSQRTFRFEVLTNRDGCKFKEHLPKIVTKQEEDVLELFSNYRDLITIEPPQLYFPERITRLVTRDSSLDSVKLSCKEPTWWEGIELAPPRPKLGLLSKIWGCGFRRSCQTPVKTQKKLRRQETKNTDGSSPISSISDSDDEAAATEYESNADDDSYNSEESRQIFNLNFIRPRRKGQPEIKRNEATSAWSADLTIRCNQDNQREFEEKVTQQMISLLTKRMNVEIKFSQKGKSTQKHQWSGVQPLGGTYVRLEAELREQINQGYKAKHSTQTTIRNTKSAKQ